MQAAEAPERAEPFYEAVCLGGHLRSSLSKAERQRAEKLVRSYSRELDRDAERVALVIALSSKTMVASALEAARTGESVEYAIGPGQRCRAALVVEINSDLLPERRTAMELILRYIHFRWTEWLEEKGETREQMAFLAGPVSIAVGLGHVFSRAPVHLVPHRPRFGAGQPNA